MITRKHVAALGKAYAKGFAAGFVAGNKHAEEHANALLQELQEQQFNLATKARINALPQECGIDTQTTKGKAE